jgi:hypothetical protein
MYLFVKFKIPTPVEIHISNIENRIKKSKVFSSQNGNHAGKLPCQRKVEHIYTT